MTSMASLSKATLTSLACLKASPKNSRNQLCEIGVGKLFKENPGKLLEILEASLSGDVHIHPEMMGVSDVVPMFPNAVTAKDMNDFHILLEDEIFANYFNLFLNLPIFPRRLNYRQDAKLFSIEPPIKRRKFRLQHTLVTAWVLMYRLPYFLKSHLYLEYKFSHDLLNDLYFDTKSLHLYHELKTPIGVNRFRIFLHSRDMTKLMSFWMDAEKFVMLNDDKSRKECFNAIEILYLKIGSRFELPESLRSGILDKIEHEQISGLTEVMVHSVPLVERIAKKEIDKIKNFSAVGVLIKAAQDQVMTFLRMYWIPRYFNRGGISYTDSNANGDVKIKSHLLWSPQLNRPTTELVKVANFNGQAPLDFENIGGDGIHAPCAFQKVQEDRDSIWNIDISRKFGRGRRERQKLNKFTLFEQARRISVTPRMKENAYMQQLAELREKYAKTIDLRKNSSPIAVPPQDSSLKPIGVPFINSPVEHEDKPDTLIVTRRRTAQMSQEIQLPKIERHRTLADHGIRLNSSLPTGNLATLALPNLQPGIPATASDESDFSDATDELSMVSETDEISCDPYILLKKVNPELMEEMGEDQLNIRKWVLGALAANALSGQPMRDYLELFQLYNGSEYGAERYPVKVWTALNNLDCWVRIERIRATSSTSYAGRRADEIVQAGGWGGLESPRLLPSYHHYLASISGQDLESHLQPFRETKYIINNYLCDCEKLLIDDDVREVLTQMLKSYNVDDSWYALLQEHCLSVLTKWVMKFFVFDDARLMMVCTSAKTEVKHDILLESRSMTTIESDAFDPEVAKDLLYQYIFSPKSERVWLSLFAIEVASYRPAEVYFPPIPSTTKSVGCSCSSSGLGKLDGEPKERQKNMRPISSKMRDSHTNLPRLQDISTKTSTIKKTPTQLIQRIQSTESNVGSVTYSGFIGTGSRRKKALYPLTFKQVLGNQEYFNIFMKYLEVHMADEAEAPLINFWHQVEIMKSYRNIKARKDKATSIHKRYLYSPMHAPRRDYLNVECPPLLEIADKKQTTPNMVVQAQTYVCKLIEDKWWNNYKLFMDDEASAKSILTSNTDVLNSNINCGKDYRANIRYLWGIFTFDLINFQNGLRNKSVFAQFRDYLIKTGAKLLNTKSKRIKDGNVLIYMNGISIYAERLQFDLDFFVEIDKWISLKCDMAGPKGKLSKETETLLTAKAQAIMACYLKSTIPPRIRVNLSQAIINEIEKRLDESKKFYRGLFYNAVLHMVTMLLPFWKKFCYLRSAKESEKDRHLISTVSGHSISTSRSSPLHTPRTYCEEFHTEKLGYIVNKKVENTKDETVKGLKTRLIQQDKVFGRRDATTGYNVHGIGTEQIMYSFNLLSGTCSLKYESGLEVLQPCEVFISPHFDKVEYLTSPLPRVKSIIPAIADRTGTNRLAPHTRHPRRGCNPTL